VQRAASATCQRPLEQEHVPLGPTAFFAVKTALMWRALGSFHAAPAEGSGRRIPLSRLLEVPGGVPRVSLDRTTCSGSPI
jgi:hypothetical protein